MTTALEQGQALKAQGQEQAASNAVDWTTLALTWIEERATQPGTFTSDDLIAAVGLPTRKVGTNQNNAVGSVFSQASRKQIVLDTGQRAQSQRVPNHAAELTVWVGVGTGLVTKMNHQAALKVLERYLVVDTEGSRFGTTKTKAERHQALFFTELRRAWGVDA